MSLGDSELCISQGDQPGGDEPDGNAAKSPRANLAF